MDKYKIMDKLKSLHNSWKSTKTYTTPGQVKIAHTIDRQVKIAYTTHGQAQIAYTTHRKVQRALSFNTELMDMNK